MDERTALFANVLNDPADDTARLVLADWLEEHGEPALGRFLRAGVIAARFRGADLIDDPDYYAPLGAIASVAKGGAPAGWLSALGVGPSPLTARDWGWDSAGDRVTVRVGSAVGLFARGMLSELSVKLEKWYEVAPAALCSWPIESATITDVPGLTFAVARLGEGWRLTGRLRVRARRVSLFGGLIPSAVAPSPSVVEPAAEWWAEEDFPARPALIAAASPASARLADDLREEAGDRWPSPPRGRG